MKKCISWVLSIIILVLFNTEPTYGMEKNLHVIGVPGQNGAGTDSWYLSPILDVKVENIIHTTHLENNIDFGQNNCLQHLQKQIKPILNDTNKPNIGLYGASQGFAICLHFLRTCTKAEAKKIRFCVAEASLICSNNAIVQTVDKFADLYMKVPGIKKIPLINYILPYAANLIFPSYNPGQLPPALAYCQNHDQLSEHLKNLPIILIHQKGDPQTPYEDAQALYAHLKTKNPNVYFIPIEEMGHIYSLMYSLNDPNEEILKKTGIWLEIQFLIEHYTGTKLDNSKLKALQDKYQPAADPSWEKHYQKLLHEQKIHSYLSPLVRLGTLSLILYMVYIHFLIKDYRSCTL
jgi:hypothetical protein